MKKKHCKKTIIYLTLTLATLIVAFLFNRLWEMLLFVACFNFLHACFYKRFHANSIEKDFRKANWLCFIITLSVQTIYLILCISIKTTVYANIFIVIGVCLINCHLQDYLDLIEDKIKDEIKRAKLGNRVFRGMSMVELECSLIKYGIVGIPNDVMHHFYVDRMKLQDIADKLGYSIERVQQIKRETLIKLTS